MHLAEEVQGQLPAPCLLTCADQAAVRNNIALTVASHHVLEDLDGFFHLQYS